MLNNGTLDNHSDEGLVAAICGATGIPAAAMTTAIKTAGSMTELLRRAKGIDKCGLTTCQHRKLESFLSATRIMAARLYVAEEKRIRQSREAGAYFSALLTGADRQEQFVLLSLNAQNVVLACTTVFFGTLNEAAVYPRVIVEQALRDGANSVMLAHNHPSGSLTASAPDLDVTRKIVAALKTIDIKVQDHIIVTPDGRYASMMEQGIMPIGM